MKGPRWTKEEEAYLERWHGRMDQKKIAAYLGKSEGSVREKSRRMGLGNLEESTDRMTCSAVAKIMGVNRKTVNSNWINKGLIAKKINRYRMVSEKDLIKFLLDNPNLWDARKCDYYYFCQYDWFQKKLEEDRKTSGPKQKPWTRQEEILLCSMRDRNIPYKKIAERLGRNHLSVARKYSYMINRQYNRGA